MFVFLVDFLNSSRGRGKSKVKGEGRGVDLEDHSLLVFSFAYRWYGFLAGAQVAKLPIRFLALYALFSSHDRECGVLSWTEKDFLVFDWGLRRFTWL